MQGAADQVFALHIWPAGFCPVAFKASHVSARDPNPSQGRIGAPHSLSDHIEHNIHSVVALQRREWEQTSASQRRVERVSRFVGRPSYLIGILGFAVVWIGSQIEAPHWGWLPFDPPPFSLLQGLLNTRCSHHDHHCPHRPKSADQTGTATCPPRSASKFIDGAESHQAHSPDGGVTARFAHGARPT